MGTGFICFYDAAIEHFYLTAVLDSINLFLPEHLTSHLDDTSFPYLSFDWSEVIVSCIDIIVYVSINEIAGSVKPIPIFILVGPV